MHNARESGANSCGLTVWPPNWMGQLRLCPEKLESQMQQNNRRIAPLAQQASAWTNWAAPLARVSQGSPFQVLLPQDLRNFRHLRSRRSHRRRFPRPQRALLPRHPGEYTIRMFHFSQSWLSFLVELVLVKLSATLCSCVYG